MRTRLQRPVLEVRPSDHALRFTQVAAPSETGPENAVLHLCPQRRGQHWAQAASHIWPRRRGGGR